MSGVGLVTTERGEMESKDVLKQRIDQASRYVPLEQLYLSPQCGFSSAVAGNVLPITKAEKDFRRTNGLEALESLLEEHAINPVDPGRAAVV